ncbi:hypothetical protein [Alkalispirochaeta sphaeroplastigenens]|nr:hypothetical protein [Alkalispirochaeta sphaeroplastigenens]
MSIFRSRSARQEEMVSTLVDQFPDGGFPPGTEAAEYPGFLPQGGLERRAARHRALEALLAVDPPGEESCKAAQERVYQQVCRTLRVRPPETPWWRQSFSVPLPLASAAVAVFLLAGVLAAGWVQRPSVSGDTSRGLAGLSLQDRNIHVQVHVDADRTEQFLQWLNEQGQAQQLTIQLPEQARFQFRGEPVMVRRDPARDLEILPLDSYPLSYPIEEYPVLRDYPGEEYRQ